MKFRYFMIRMEKSFLFFIKTLMMIFLFLTFFGMFSYKIPQLLILNRTSLVSFIVFFVSVYAFIRIYGGFPVGQKHTEDIRNSAILGTLMGDIITFIIIYVMDISSFSYHEFTDEINSNLGFGPNASISVPFRDFLGHHIVNEVLPGLVILIITFVLQIIIISVFSNFSNTIYFKINKPKRALIIYKNPTDLPLIVSKIKKYPKRWVITSIINCDEEDIKRKIRDNQSIFFIETPKQERDNLLTYCYKHNKDIYINPDISDIIIKSSNSFLLDDTMTFSNLNSSMSFEQLVIKRIGDIVFSSILIVLSSPIMLICSLLIKCHDKGPILYKQNRLTKGGREFNLLKFRSMIVNAEKETGATIAKENDERITKIGKFLRRFRLDELPQLFNIFKGDMSVVGPRPERIEIAEEYEKDLPEFRYRLKVKAGLTGLAQIMSKYNTVPKDKLILDLVYIQQYSLWLDIKLILQTMIVFLKSDSTQGSKLIDKDSIEFVKHELSKEKNSKLLNGDKDER